MKIMILFFSYSYSKWSYKRWYLNKIENSLFLHNPFAHAYRHESILANLILESLVQIVLNRIRPCILLMSIIKWQKTNTFLFAKMITARKGR